MIDKVTQAGSMKSHLFEKILLGTLLMTLSQANADAAGFGIGPRRVASAWNVNRGALLLSTQGRFYTKRDIFTADDGSVSGVTVWDSQLSAAFSYGLFRSLQLDFAPVLLQKTHQPNRKIDSPGDFYFAAKLGLLSAARLKTALRVETSVPFGEHHNIPLQSYSADAVGFGGAALISAHLLGKNPERGLSVDLNLGYFNHNDRDIRLTDSPADTFSAQGTQELRGGAALRLMGAQYGLYAEVLSRSYLTLPPPTAYARENSTVLSFGMLYQFNPYILVTLGMDLLASGKRDETLYALDGALLTPKPWQTLPNYPDWRFNLGLSFRLAKGKTVEPKEKPKLQEKEKEEKKSEQIAASPQSKEKAPKKAKKKEKTNTEGTDKKIAITDVRELERRLREKREQGVETEAQRAERIVRERERMEVLLTLLHERLRLEAELKREAEAAAKAAAEAKAAEEKTAAKAEQAATPQDQTVEIDQTSSDENAAESESAPDDTPAVENSQNDPPSEPSPEDREPSQAPPTETDMTPE